MLDLEDKSFVKQMGLYNLSSEAWIVQLDALKLAYYRNS